MTPCRWRRFEAAKFVKLVISIFRRKRSQLLCSPSYCKTYRFFRYWVEEMKTELVSRSVGLFYWCFQERRLRRLASGVHRSDYEVGIQITMDMCPGWTNSIFLKQLNKITIDHPYIANPSFIQFITCLSCFTGNRLLHHNRCMFPLVRACWPKAT